MKIHCIRSAKWQAMRLATTYTPIRHVVVLEVDEHTDHDIHSLILSTFTSTVHNI